MRLDPYCELLESNRPNNDSDEQFEDCVYCYRYDICKEWYKKEGLIE